MKIVKSIEFGSDDGPVLRQLVELCGTAASFFYPESGSSTVTLSGLNKVTRFQSGGIWKLSHFRDAEHEIKMAMSRIDDTPVRGYFPAELKKHYKENLLAAMGMVEGWKGLVDE